MKKKILSMLLTLALIFPFAAPVFAIDVVVSDQKLTLDQEPVIENGRTLVPMRAIFEALGATVQWNDVTQTVTSSKGTDEIKLLINNPNVTLNGRTIVLDTPAKIINNRTMVPVRFVSESLGANVIWDDATRGVYVNSTVPIVKNTFQEATVTRITDGDTIEAMINGVNQKIRLIGVDTPEVYGGAEYFGPEASAYTKSLIPVGAVIYLQKDVSETDRYGRLLRYVWIQRPTSDNPTYDEVQALSVNGVLVSNGYARPSTYPPDVKYADSFLTMSQLARNSGWGL